MSIIGYIIVGIIAGWLAGVITKTDRSIWGDLVLGLAGALVGGLVTDGLVSGDNGWIPAIIVSTIAAVILVVVKNMVTGRSRRAL